MLPDNVASSISFGGIYLPPDERVTSPLVDYESGGIALLDTSQGLFARNWKLMAIGVDVYLQPDGGEPELIFQDGQITEISLTFDQNMRWAVTYISAGVLKLRWFDAQVGQHIVSTFGEAANPKIALDDKRVSQANTSDMILAYLRGTSLYYRQQRDRFAVERLLRSNLFPNTRLKNIGMNKNLRLQFELV